MKIEEISRRYLDGNSEELIVHVDKKDLQLLGYILETIEGMCYYSTIDKDDSQVKITYTVDYKLDIEKILKSLREHE
ncbi:MAG TPA: DUF4911 domain-containing protein [Candidatus Cloacimonetes bacterium]|nr:DUF4911 domain-containing protein [Candidatus Cloacimonadota bacterium]HEX37615.1 DUF4911 domain-containing protein [Candidatus Cloacimonadota bacterium]